MKTLDKLNPLNFLKKVNIFVNAERNEEEEKKKKEKQKEQEK